MEILKNIKVEKEVFKESIKSIKFEGKKPVVMAFITPDFNLFDLFRLAKLSEFVKEGFFLTIILKDTNKRKTRSFVDMINLFIPKNKKIYYYLDFYKELLEDENFISFISAYKINWMKNFLNKIGEDPEIKKVNFSLSDLEGYIFQYYMINNSQTFFGIDPDFFITSKFKEIFFKTIKMKERILLPSRIILSDTPINVNLVTTDKEIEREIYNARLEDKKTKKLKTILFTILKPFNVDKKGDVLPLILKIKEIIGKKDKYNELHISKENYVGCIRALNNNIRREIIYLIKNYDNLKAGGVRMYINKLENKKYSLTSILKHLKILIDSKILIKNKRVYKLNTQRIVMNLPISWLKR